MEPAQEGLSEGPPPLIQLDPAPAERREGSVARSTSSRATPGTTRYPVVVCTDCKYDVEFHPCKTNESGNQGLLVATCKRRRQNKETKEEFVCNFIRWATDEVNEAYGITPRPVSYASIQPAPTDSQVATTSRPVCQVPGCGQHRLSPNCERPCTCKRHCIELGGCIVHYEAPPKKGLPPPPPPPLLAPPPPPLLLPPPPVSDSAAPPPNTQPASTVPKNAKNTNGSLSTVAQGTVPQPFSNPRHVSQMAPIFTDLVQREQVALEDRRKQQAESLAYAKRVTNTIPVYGWKESGAAPIVRKVQVESAFIKLTKELFGRLGLVNIDDFQMYDTASLEIWIDIDVDHIIEFIPGDIILLRDRHALDLPGFKEALAKLNNKPIHLRHNTVGERAAVRTMIKSEPTENPGPSSSRPAALGIKAREARHEFAAAPVPTGKDLLRAKRVDSELAAPSSRSEPAKPDKGKGRSAIIPSPAPTPKVERPESPDPFDDFYVDDEPLVHSPFTFPKSTAGPSKSSSLFSRHLSPSAPPSRPSSRANPVKRDVPHASATSRVTPTQKDVIKKEPASTSITAKREPTEPSTHGKRPRASNSSVEVIEISSNTSSSFSQDSPSSSSRHSSSRPQSPAEFFADENGVLDDPIWENDEAEQEPKWPSDYFICDLMQYFQNVKSINSNGGIKHEDIFRKTFPDALYSRQRCSTAWIALKALDPNIREQAFHAGRSPQGLYSYVTKQEAKKKKKEEDRRRKEEEKKKKKKKPDGEKAQRKKPRR
ncbi:hypothetical protein FA13DRAFT_1781217 [Coprinellus micaceus]|uniref:Uncharacterized protein n=1 Tax=Coprinellus micaceus TaxID=71717 RepID=A0A4Y7SAJ3_COPMI|nr:hypothetical protein FA13DRAFT_1781217 [Coprinellus micaceus]